MKRMLEEKDGKFYINASSAEVIQTCRRKAYYALKRNLRNAEESDALLFGKALHTAMEAFYLAKPGERTLEQVEGLFVDSAGPMLAHIPDTDKRSVSNGRKIIRAYFETYRDDPWTVVVDAAGPVVERKFELQTAIPWMVVHGQIDCILQNTETGEVVVCDHKTSSSLGSDFMNRISPNLQFSLYSWAANQLGFNVQRVMVNGIQVAKTKTDLVRVFTSRGQDDWQEAMQSLADACNLYRASDMADFWALNTASCAQYGGCPYLQFCSLAKQHRETAIKAQFGDQT